MSRNKSRKRILHEQRVEISRLNRALDSYKIAMARARWSYRGEEIRYAYIVRSDLENDELKDLFKNSGEQIIRDIVRKIVSSEVMQITLDKHYPATHLATVNFRLRFMSWEHTDIDPKDAFGDIQRVNFYDPEILYGGHRLNEAIKRGIIERGPYKDIINTVWGSIDKNE